MLLCTFETPCNEFVIVPACIAWAPYFEGQRSYKNTALFTKASPSSPAEASSVHIKCLPGHQQQIQGGVHHQRCTRLLISSLTNADEPILKQEADRSPWACRQSIAAPAL